MKLEIIDYTNSSLADRKFLKDCGQFFENALVKRKILPAPSHKKLIITFISPITIQSLNKQFLKKDCVTDVLSFSSLEKDSFGEIALCTEKIKSQALVQGFTVKEETAYLVLHGFLHLLGYQHEQGGRPAKIMYQIQDEIFSQWQSSWSGKAHL